MLTKAQLSGSYSGRPGPRVKRGVRGGVGGEEGAKRRHQHGSRTTFSTRCQQPGNADKALPTHPGFIVNRDDQSRVPRGGEVSAHVMACVFTVPYLQSIQRSRFMSPFRTPHPPTPTAGTE